MASDTDFLALYQELGLTAGSCTLDEFKQAYRRRVVQLHPDRHPAEDAEVPDPAQLQRLTTLYGAAIAFERRYGRLPGLGSTLRRPVISGNHPVVHHPASIRAEQGSRRWLLALLILAALAWGLWGIGNTGQRRTPEVSSSASSALYFPPDNDPGTPATHAQIMLGTSAAQVRRIEGDPINPGGDHWDYGPSWVEFKKGKVSDWYSSPLRPLDVDSAHAPPPAATAAPTQD